MNRRMSSGECPGVATGAAPHVRLANAKGPKAWPLFEVSPLPPQGLLVLQLRRPQGPSPQEPRQSPRFSGLFLAPAQHRLLRPAPVAPYEASALLAVGHKPEPLRSPLPRMRDTSSFLCRLNQKLFGLSTRTFLNSSDHDTPSRRLEPTLLIWGKWASRRFSIISLKRQEPTRLSQSQSPCSTAGELEI
jgi:hypothetical protein